MGAVSGPGVGMSAGVYSWGVGAYSGPSPVEPGMYSGGVLPACTWGGEIMGPERVCWVAAMGVGDVGCEAACSSTPVERPLASGAGEVLPAGCMHIWCGESVGRKGWGGWQRWAWAMSACCNSWKRRQRPVASKAGRSGGVLAAARRRVHACTWGGRGGHGPERVHPCAGNDAGDMGMLRHSFALPAGVRLDGCRPMGWQLVCSIAHQPIDRVASCNVLSMLLMLP